MDRWKTSEQQTVEARYGLSIEEVLRRLYIEERKSQDDIAVELGVSRASVMRWMKQHGIPRGYNRSVAR